MCIPGATLMLSYFLSQNTKLLKICRIGFGTSCKTGIVALDMQTGKNVILCNSQYMCSSVAHEFFCMT